MERRQRKVGTIYKRKGGHFSADRIVDSGGKMVRVEYAGKTMYLPKKDIDFIIDIQVEDRPSEGGKK